MWRHLSLKPPRNIGGNIDFINESSDKLENCHMLPNNNNDAAGEAMTLPRPNLVRLKQSHAIAVFSEPLLAHVKSLMMHP